MPGPGRSGGTGRLRRRSAAGTAGPGRSRCRAVAGTRGSAVLAPQQDAGHDLAPRAFRGPRSRSTGRTGRLRGACRGRGLRGGGLGGGSLGGSASLSLRGGTPRLALLPLLLQPVRRPRLVPQEGNLPAVPEETAGREAAGKAGDAAPAPGAGTGNLPAAAGHGRCRAPCPAGTGNRPSQQQSRPADEDHPENSLTRTGHVSPPANATPAAPAPDRGRRTGSRAGDRPIAPARTAAPARPMLRRHRGRTAGRPGRSRPGTRPR